MLKDVLANIRKEKLKKERRRTAKKIALGTVSGIAAGVASGLLLAPKSGKETRKDIADAASEINTKVKERAITAKDSLQNKSEELKSNVAEAREKISTYLSERKANSEKDTVCTDCCGAANEKEIEEEVSQNNNAENN